MSYINDAGQEVAGQSERLKIARKYLMWAAIGLFSASAVMGIFFLWFGTDEAGGRVISTTSIMGLLALFSMNNIIRMESGKQRVRMFSVTALVANIFWALPWILLVWGVFAALSPYCHVETHTLTYTHDVYTYQSCDQQYYDMLSGLWKLVAIAGIISVVTTLAASFLNIKNYSPILRWLKIVTIVCAVGLGIFFIICLLFDAWPEWEVWRLLAMMAIVMVFGLIVTPIVAKVQSKREKDAMRVTYAGVGTTTNMNTSEATPVIATDTQQISEQMESRLRRQIERELRVKIEAEVRAQVEQELRKEKSVEKQQVAEIKEGRVDHEC